VLEIVNGDRQDGGHGGTWKRHNAYERAMTCPSGASEALTEDLVVLGNPDVILRYYSLPLRWCADVRGAREGDKGLLSPVL